jgi:hypothetical protein
MPLRTELSAAVLGHHIDPILILVIFFFWASLKDKVYNINTRKEEELKENIRITASKGKSEPLLLVRGMSMCKGTAFSTPPVICKL